MPNTPILAIEEPAGRNGYPGMAAWTARNPDYETFIFRRFDRLSARNLLHLESQVAGLEAQLDRPDEHALQHVRLNPDDLEASRSIRNWELLSVRAKDTSLLDHKRMILVEQISAKLKEYRESFSHRAEEALLSTM